MGMLEAPPSGGLLSHTGSLQPPFFVPGVGPGIRLRRAPARPSTLHSTAPGTLFSVTAWLWASVRCGSSDLAEAAYGDLLIHF